SLHATMAGILAAGALAIAGCGGSGSDGNADQAPIDGSWKGPFTQSGVADFQGYVEIDTLRAGMVSGTVFYPGIGGSGGCSGALIYKSREGSDYLFTEQIITSENPNCTKRGDVKVTSVDDGDGIRYAWSSGKQSSVGNLREWDD
ncbi:MAG: hypothetical protein ACKOTA_06055, partial [Solirubrobacterales bacterium]